MTREKWKELYGDRPLAKTVDEAVEYKKQGIKYTWLVEGFMELREDGYWYATEEAKEKLDETWTQGWRINNETGRFERIEK